MGAGGAFGIGQRDDFTVSSELVRLGDATGQPVVVRNFGVPENLFLDDEVAIVRRRLTNAAPPNLVIFYDGFNDALFNWMYAASHGGKPLARDQRGKDWINEFIHLSDPPKISATQVQAVVDHVVADYRRAQREIQRDLANRGITSVFFFQPDAFSSLTQSQDFIKVLRAAGLEQPPENGLAAVLERSAASLSRTVRNLRATVAASAERYFADPSNMNEAGAAFAANEMWPTVRRLIQPK